MQIIPVNEEEALMIDKNLSSTRNASFVASTMLFSISPLTSPKRRDSVSVNDTNLHKQIIINKLETVVEEGQQQEKKYQALQNKIHKFNLK